MRKIKRYDKMGFGRYRDKTLDWVLKYSPSYVNWCINNVRWVQFSDWTKNKVREWKNKLYREKKGYYSDNYDDRGNGGDELEQEVWSALYHDLHY